MKKAGLVLGTIWFFLSTPLFALPKFQYDPEHPFLTPEFQNEINQLTQSELIQGNKFELLIDALPSLTKKIEIAKEAKESILLSTMIFLTHLDPLMKEFCNILMQKVKEGVSVYIIMDKANSYVDSQIFRKLERGGVQVTYFNPIFSSSDPIPVGIRMHEKYMIVDDAKAILGGQNMYDERYSFLPFEAMNWRDTDIYIEGPLVYSMSKHFLDVWNSIEKNGKKRDGPKINLPTHSWGTENPRVSDPPFNKDPFHSGESRFIYNEPYQGQKFINAFYLKLIREAKNQIIWEGNQVVLDEEFEMALKEAANRGVKVTLMTNSWATAWWQPIYYQYFFLRGYRPFLNSKVNLRLYQSRYNHSKIFYVDGVITSIGSFNHDLFSLENDAEATLVFYDKSFNESVYNQLISDLEDTSSFWFPF